MIRINLLPVRAAQKKEKLRSQLSILFLCLILVGAVCAALYVTNKLKIDGIKDEIADLDRQNQALKKKLGEVSDFEKKKQDLEQKLAVLGDLKTAKAGPVHLLDELSLALPAKVWLTSFSESGGSVKLSGYGDNERTVASFMDRLEKSPYYRNIELTVTEQATVAEIKMQKFTLECQTEKPPANNDGVE